MPDKSDQLAQLGQQVIDAITAAYNPHNDSSLALALHPGQAIDDKIVQNGVTNELRISEWLASRYDYPVLLKLADGTPVVTTGLGGVTAKSAYATMARYSRPGVPADSSALPRLEQLISDVRRDTGEHPETLPFGCEPTDFAQADSPAWQLFDTVIATHTSETTVVPHPDDGTFVAPNRELWKIRALPDEVLAALPERRLAAVESHALSDELSNLSVGDGIARLDERRVQSAATASVTDTTPVADMSAIALQSVDVTEATSALSTDTVRASAYRMPVSSDTSRASAYRMPIGAVSVRDTIAADTELRVVDPVVAVAPTTFQLDDALAQDLVHVNISDLAAQPAISTATTSDSSLHVHFEFIVLAITRLLAGRPWWHPEFVQEKAWFVPGMTRGTMVAEPPDSEHAHCLPQSLLVVRNVSMTGVWSDEARATMTQAVHYVGPFLMSPVPAQVATADATTAQQTTMVGLGVQVIGELCSALPALPPMDEPPPAGP